MSKVQKIKVDRAFLHAQTQKGEYYVLALEDAFAGAIDAPPSGSSQGWLCLIGRAPLHGGDHRRRALRPARSRARSDRRTGPLQVISCPPLLCGVMSLWVKSCRCSSRRSCSTSSPPPRSRTPRSSWSARSVDSAGAPGCAVDALAGLRELPEGGLAPVPSLISERVASLLLGVITVAPACARRERERAARRPGALDPPRGITAALRRAHEPRPEAPFGAWWSSWNGKTASGRAAGDYPAGSRRAFLELAFLARRPIGDRRGGARDAARK